MEIPKPPKRMSVSTFFDPKIVLPAIGQAFVKLDTRTLVKHPAMTAHAQVSWLILGGTALFLLGHAAFKATVWRIVPWTRLAAAVVLAALALLTGHVSQLALAGLAALVVLAVAAAVRVHFPQAGPDAAAKGRLDR